MAILLSLFLLAHEPGGAGTLSFRTTTTVGTRVQTVELAYCFECSQAGPRYRFTFGSRTIERCAHALLPRE